jgi:hypothetical protein
MKRWLTLLILYSLLCPAASAATKKQSNGCGSRKQMVLDTIAGAAGGALFGAAVNPWHRGRSAAIGALIFGGGSIVANRIEAADCAAEKKEEIQEPEESARPGYNQNIKPARELDTQPTPGGPSVAVRNIVGADKDAMVAALPQAIAKNGYTAADPYAQVAANYLLDITVKFEGDKNDGQFSGYGLGYPGFYSGFGYGYGWGGWYGVGRGKAKLIRRGTFHVWVNTYSSGQLVNGLSAERDVGLEVYSLENKTYFVLVFGGQRLKEHYVADAATEAALRAIEAIFNLRKE